MTLRHIPMIDRCHKSSTGVQASDHMVEMSRMLWRSVWETKKGSWRRIRGGHSWQLLEMIGSWNGNIRMKAPRRENWCIASRSSQTRAPLLLLPQINRVYLCLLLPYLHHLHALPLQFWGSGLLLNPHKLLPLCPPVPIFWHSTLFSHLWQFILQE